MHVLSTIYTAIKATFSVHKINTVSVLNIYRQRKKL